MTEIAADIGLAFHYAWREIMAMPISRLNYFHKRAIAHLKIIYGA